MRKYRVTGVIPGDDKETWERAEACAAYAAERGQRLTLVSARTLVGGADGEARDDEALEIERTEAPDGFLVFLSAESISGETLALIRALKERYPQTEIRGLLPRPDEKETVTTYLAYWPSRAAVDQLRGSDTDRFSLSEDNDV